MDSTWHQNHWVSVSPAAKAWRKENGIPEFPPLLLDAERPAWRAGVAARMARDDAWNWFGMGDSYGPLDPAQGARQAFLLETIGTHPARAAVRQASRVIGRAVAEAAGRASAILRREGGTGRRSVTASHAGA